MGWSKTLTSNKPVAEEDIRTVIKQLPDKLKGFIKGAEQSWGWSCAVDVAKPKNNEFTLGGSYSISGDIKEEFTNTFVKLMGELGYTLTVESHD